MKTHTFFRDYLARMCEVIVDVDHAALNDAVALIRATKRARKKILMAGNGGSAAIASHVAVDFTKAVGVRAMSFNVPELITCFGNDYGYERWVERALGFYADPGDLVILISSSGKSPNILNAARLTKRSRLKLITFSGFSSGNPLRKLGDINFWLDSSGYNIVEMTHSVWLGAILDALMGLDLSKERKQ